MANSASSLKGNVAITLWLLLAVLFILPMLKYQHVAEHVFEISNNTIYNTTFSAANSQQKYHVDDDCKICISAAFQQFANTSTLLTLPDNLSSEMVAVFFQTLLLSHTLKHFCSRAPPAYF